MTKAISKIGNSNGIIFDATFMSLAHLKPGDEFNVEIHEGGTISLTPIRPRSHLSKEITQTIKSTINDYARTMKRLA
jgi:antitoxin component of MazEF toxin-antitoxin module